MVKMPILMEGTRTASRESALTEVIGMMLLVALTVSVVLLAVAVIATRVADRSPQVNQHGYRMPDPCAAAVGGVR